MKKKIVVTLLFGGKSAEHEVSLATAKSVYKAINKDTYTISLIAIDRRGGWHLVNERFLHRDPHGMAEYLLKREELKSDALMGRRVFPRNVARTLSKTEVVFPLIHGTNGEDGTVQGFLELFDIPYVGAGVLGSAVGMDKDVMKRLLRDADIPVARWITLRSPKQHTFSDIQKKLSKRVFVKPANAGSSVGVSKVRNDVEYKEALKKAFSYDEKVLVEEAIEGKEIECAVFGNAIPRVSVCGEISFQDDFYAYETKYGVNSGTEMIIPAHIPDHVSFMVQEMSRKVFKTLETRGLARVDFFVTLDERIFVNEINTLPGFTSMSMYPKLWEASGISYSALIDHLLVLAHERYKIVKKRI